MSEIWNKVYKSDKAFFGEEASNFALLCFNHMKMNNVNRILELGAGHGRDSTFFASNGIEVEALDYSIIAIELLDKITKEKRLPIKPQIFDVKRALPFPNGYFDAVFSEMRRVLKPNGFNFFSVRKQNDKSYGEGVQIDKGIYDISGFQVQFFTEEEIRDLTKGFEILCIAEEYEEPVTLYLVFTNKL